MSKKIALTYILLWCTVLLQGQDIYVSTSFHEPATEGLRFIYSYDGVIKAGMDFSGIGFSVDEAGKTIRVTLPETRILSNEIDSNSIKVYDEKHSAFTLVRAERFSESIGTLKKEAEENAVSKGLLTEARRNAETLLSGFLSAGFDMNEYSLQFMDQERSGEP